MDNKFAKELETNVIVLNELDNVAVLKKHKDLAGHKIAIRDIQEGEQIIKYGMPIGFATELIQRGDHVHVQNCKTGLSEVVSYKYEPIDCSVEKVQTDKTFKGYRRYNNKVGIRNELWIIPTVGCVAGIANRIVKQFENDHNLSETYDGIYVFNHQFGCSQMGDDHANTRKVLGEMVKHPNAGGVLVLGLGCENNQISIFEEVLGDYDRNRTKFIIAQEVEDEVEESLQLLEQLYEFMIGDKREDCPISELKIGLECGGSDGFSGITANPLVGKISDEIVGAGGSVVLTEVPEMFGAETILMNRCINEEVYGKTVEMINNFKNYYRKNGQVIYENPSPGNKKGGITTLEDKSLGCTEKSGKVPVVDVLEYGEQIRKAGLSLLTSPGNDIVATTALGVSGCQLVLFTTGRGTPFGGFIPTLKIATTTELSEKKPKWIDFNAGIILDDNGRDAKVELLCEIIEVASGKWVKNEEMNFREIGFFKQGIML